MATRGARTVAHLQEGRVTPEESRPDYSISQFGPRASGLPRAGVAANGEPAEAIDSARERHELWISGGPRPEARGPLDAQALDRHAAVDRNALTGNVRRGRHREERHDG